MTISKMSPVPLVPLFEEAVDDASLNLRNHEEPLEDISSGDESMGQYEVPLSQAPPDFAAVNPLRCQP